MATAVRTASDRLAVQHQKDVAGVAGGAASAVIQTAMGADPAAISTWFFSALDGLMARIQAGYAINRRSAMGYLPQHGALNGVTVSAVPGSLDIGSTRARLNITGPVAFKRAIGAGYEESQALRSMASQMGGVADELVRNGDRDVITETMRHGRGLVAYRRRLAGRSCGFCAMLASRGAVYTAESVTFRTHPSCKCFAEPVYRHQQEPPEVQRLQRQWRRVTAGKHGDNAVREWRRHWEQRATPAARLREGIAPPRLATLVDDYTERAMTRREYEIANLEQKIATAKADRAEFVKSWERAIAREGPNGDPAMLAYYRGALENARNLPTRLRQELADVRKRKDPALDLPHPTAKLRTGTPSPQRAQAYMRGQVGENVTGADRVAITGELERQAALVPRSTMRLGEVRFGEVGEDISFGGDPLAAYSPFNDVLYSRRWMETPASRAAIEESVQRSAVTKWWTRYDGQHGGIGGTTAHEFGHHIDRLIGRAPAQAKQLAEAISREFHFPLDPKALDYRAEIQRFVSENERLVSVEVSKYGAKNANEFFAEIWREYSTMGTAARPKIRRIGELMRQLAEDNAFGPAGRIAGQAAERALALEAADLSTLKLPQLRALAKERGLTGYSKLTKPQLLERLGGEAKPVSVVKPAGDLSGMKVPELRALAKERGITGYSKLTKPQLLERLGKPRGSAAGSTSALEGSAAQRSIPVKARINARNSDSTTWRATGFDGLARADKEAADAVTAYLRQPGRLNLRLRFPDDPTHPLHDQTLDELLGRVPFNIRAAAEAAARADVRIAALDRILARSLLPEDVVTWRGVPIEHLGKLPANLVGHEFTDLGFVSTSTTRAVAEHSFAGGGEGALLRILARAGTPALGFEGLGEAEMLLGRGLRFRVVADRGQLTKRSFSGKKIPGPRLLEVEIIPKAEAKSVGEDLVIAARERQAAIDYARARADLLTEAEHWLDSQGSFETMGAQLRRDAKRLGVEGHKDVAALFRALDSGSEAKVRKAIDAIAGKQKLARIESAGDVIPFDRTKHAALGKGVREGQNVVVVRPGYTFDRNGELIRLHKATVQVATKEDVAAARKLTIPSRPEPASGADLLKKSGADSLARQIDKRAASRVDESLQGRGRGLVHDRHGSNGDEQLWEILERQGFNRKPTVVSRQELDRLIAEDQHIELFRGFRDHGAKTAEQYAEQFRSGSNFAGYGLYGNGTYTTDTLSKALRMYSERRESAVARMAISPSAKMITYRSLERLHAQFLATLKPGSLAASVWGDPGRYAAALGFDVIVQPALHGTEYVILNRSVLFIQAAS